MKKHTICKILFGFVCIATLGVCKPLPLPLSASHTKIAFQNPVPTPDSNALPIPYQDDFPDYS